MAFKFLKAGKESADLAAKQAAEAQAYRENQGKLFRFWLKEQEEARITFVDGDLSPDGYLVPPRYYEHGLYLNGSWNNFFVCPEKTNPEAKDSCPICVAPDRPSLVALFTIIDHRTFHGSKDKSKVYVDTKKLMVCKPQTFELLNKIAMKRGGLAGCTFDVSRIGDKAAAVGSLFDFVVKTPISELKAKYQVEKTDPKTNQKVKVTNFEVADYEKEITYRTGDELRKLGLGQIPAAATEQAAEKAGKPVDYSEQL